MSLNSETNIYQELPFYTRDNQNVYPGGDEDPVQPYHRTRTPEFGTDTEQFIADMKKQQEAFFFTLNNSFNQLTSQMSALMQVMHRVVGLGSSVTAHCPFSIELAG